jgi:hypothetical protein
MELLESTIQFSFLRKKEKQECIPKVWPAKRMMITSHNNQPTIPTRTTKETKFPIHQPAQDFKAGRSSEIRASRSGAVSPSLAHRDQQAVVTTPQIPTLSAPRFYTLGFV